MTARYLLAAEIEDTIEKMIPTGLIRDLTAAAFQMIDFDEVAEHFMNQ